MKIRRADRCGDCRLELAAGTEAFWDSSAKVVRCLACGGAGRPTPPAPPGLVVPDTPAELLTASATNVAGLSARREHERRSQRERAKKEKVVADDLEWRRAAVEKRPIVGRLVTSFTPKPVVGPESQPTKAWAVGAEGEERVAEVLAAVAGIEALHDRRVPRSKANVDHIVVGPAGIYVIDAKKYKHGAPIEAKNVGTRRKPDERLYVDGRNRTKLVDGVLWQVGVVRTALGPEFGGVPIRGVLCFIGPDWGWRPKVKNVKGVIAIWPKALPGLVTLEGPHGIAIERIAGHLRSALPPATG